MPSACRGASALLPALLMVATLLAAVTPAAAAAAAASGTAVPRPHPLELLHLSDIHYSTNVRKYWRQFGDREGDAALFAQRLVPRLAPWGVALTGDITDSKVPSCLPVCVLGWGHPPLLHPLHFSWARSWWF